MNPSKMDTSEVKDIFHCSLVSLVQVLGFVAYEYHKAAQFCSAHKLLWLTFRIVISHDKDNNKDVTETVLIIDLSISSS